MSQLYARVFVQILDSSIAEDFTTRHIFEDFLKLSDPNGIVDITRHAMSRRLNVPIDLLNDAIKKLESPDAASRDEEYQGRRLLPLDDHRDWGWQIANWKKYESVKCRADVATRVAKHRANFDAYGSIEKLTEQPEIITAWQSWVQHRKESRKPLTSETAKRQLAKLKEWGPARFLAALETSTMNGWQGLFEPKTGNQHNANGITRSNPQQATPSMAGPMRDFGTGHVPKYDWDAISRADMEAVEKSLAERVSPNEQSHASGSKNGGLNRGVVP